MTVPEIDAKKAPRRKRESAARDVPTLLTLDYQLAELTSAQHRAGLAGLVLMVDWLARQPPPRRGRCELSRRDDGGATLEIDREGLAALLDEVYGATQEEMRSEKLMTRKSGTGDAKEPIDSFLREETVTVPDATGKPRVKRYYYYTTVVPRGAFLEELDPSPEGARKLWVKLWRDMVWSILRGNPQTREPFDARAEKRPPSDVAKVWDALARGPDHTVDLPSTYYLGAQDCTAENVPFRDRARYQFLLHFWPYCAQVYVPQVFDPQDGKRSFVGYALAIPDVGRLATFCKVLPGVMRGRDVEPSGFRPAGALVDIAVESALDLSCRLRAEVEATEGGRLTKLAVLGIEVLHVDKPGQTVKLLSMSRLEPERLFDDAYTRLRRAYEHPRFRRNRLLNLVYGRPWHAGCDELAATLPYEQTIGSAVFRADARKAFEMERKATNVDNDETEKDPEALDQEDMVYRIVQRYVLQRVEIKTELNWQKAQEGGEAGKKKYNEAKERVAKDAFLAVRSRTGEDFIDYFAGTLCSVSQRMKPAQFREFSKALRADPEAIRTMTLLALAANG